MGDLLKKMTELYEEGTRSKEERRKGYKPLRVNFFDALDGCRAPRDDPEEGKGTPATVPRIQKEGV
jgi:hypothetical protein